MKVEYLVIIFSLNAVFAEGLELSGDYVSPVGGSAVFICSGTATEIQWLVNGLLVNVSNSRHVTLRYASTRAALEFMNIPMEFNMTTIQCRDERTTSSDAMLLLQGLLSAVGSLGIYNNASTGTISLNWTPPFTLDITGVDPDITGYCVDVTIASSHSTPTLHSQCGINVTEFNFVLPPDSGCHQYVATVKPVNILGNGSLSSVELSPNCAHGLENVTFTENDCTIPLTALYSENFTARGALFSFVFITDSGDVDFNRSFLLALDRNTSHNHTLPFDLYPGHYKMYVYDIEYNGTLHNGLGYPAVTEEHYIGQNICPSQFPHYQHALTCHINTLAHSILAHCSAPIQVIALPKDISEVHKLYVNQSMDLHTPVTVPVERDGEYQVSIFAIREGMGILGSGVGYTELVMVLTPPMESTTPSLMPGYATTSISEKTRTSYWPWIAIGLGIALGAASLIAVIMTGVTTVLCCKLRSQSSTDAHNKVQTPLATIFERDVTISAAMATQQLYEEIRDVYPSPPNIVAPESAPGTPAVPMHYVEYEDVKPALGVAESGGTYHFTLCSAYSVPLERGKDSSRLA